MADPATPTSTNRGRSGPSLSQLKSADLNTEDGYRAWTKAASGLTKGTGEEIAFAAELLRKILSVTPSSNPKTGAFSGGYDSRQAARKIAAYLRRAADSQRYAEGQIKAAWKLFENAFVIEIQGAPKGMKMDRDKKKTGGGSNRTAS